MKKIVKMNVRNEKFFIGDEPIIPSNTSVFRFCNFYSNFHRGNVDWQKFDCYIVNAKSTSWLVTASCGIHVYDSWRSWVAIRVENCTETHSFRFCERLKFLSRKSCRLGYNIWKEQRAIFILPLAVKKILPKSNYGLVGLRERFDSKDFGFFIRENCISRWRGDWGYKPGSFDFCSTRRWFSDSSQASRVSKSLSIGLGWNFKAIEFHLFAIGTYETIKIFAGLGTFGE